MAYIYSDGAAGIQPSSPLPTSLPPLTAAALSSGFLGTAGAGATIGTAIVPGIGTAIGAGIGAVAGLIGSIFGGGPDTPTEQQQVIDSLRSFFPDQNSLMCGQPADLSALNGGQPLWLNISCSDPNFANFSRSTAEWFIKLYGLAAFLSLVKPYLSTSLLGQPTTGGAVSGTSPTAGLDTGLTTLTNTLGGVIGAITGAIDSSTTQAASGQQAAIGAITGTLDTFTSGLQGLSTTIGSTITSSIGSLLDSLFNPSGNVIGAITAAIDGLAREQQGVLETILGGIGQDLGAVENSILGLGISLGDILRNLWKSLPTILVQVLGAEIPGLKDIVHAIEILTGHLPGTARSGIDYGDFGNIFARIMAAAESIAGATGVPISTIYQPQDPLTSACSLEDATNKLESRSGAGVKLPDWAQTAIKSVGAVFVEVTRAIPFLLNFERLAEESQSAACPITKLAPGDVLRALTRGYLSSSDAGDELLKQGISPSRFKVLQDLSRYLEDAGTVIDQWWRGILTDDDVQTLLAQNGFSNSQVDAAKKASFRITPVPEATDAYNRGLISDDQFGIIATANRLDDVQVDLLRALRQRPPSPQEALRGTLTRDALGGLSIPFFTDFDTVPGYFTTACHAAGLDDNAARDLWWSHWNVGDIGSWITAYFRGQRLYAELLAVAGSFGVPETYLSDLIAINRPLIPYRTVPAMIKAGTISESRGRDILAHHGFESQDIDDLLKYAAVGSKTTKAATAQANHDESLATAKTAYDDGILTADQYTQLLQAHGLDASAAAVTIQVADIANEVKARKQVATDVVDEYNAGLLDQQGAIQQLAISGLTVAEQAAAIRKMKSAQSTKAKQPSEAELRAFAQHDIITPDEYQSRLSTIGYSVADSQHFRDLHFPAS